MDSADRDSFLVDILDVIVLPRLEFRVGQRSIKVEKTVVVAPATYVHGLALCEGLLFLLEVVVFARRHTADAGKE